MARTKEKRKRRPYSTGCVIDVPTGKAIRWRERVLKPDGSIRTQQKYKALGSVSQKEANQALLDRLAACRDPRPGPIPFEELAASWKNTVLPMYGKYSTRKHHADILEKKLLPVFGECRIDRISRQQIQVAVSGWHQTGFSPSSVHHYHSVLSAILKKAMEWGYIGSNPAHGVKLPKLKLVRPKVVLTPDEAQRLLAGLSVLPQTIVALALLAGLRRGELFALRWQSFNESDPHRPFLNIQEGIYEDVIDTPKTESSLRVVPLSKEAVCFLRDWRTIAPKRGIEDFIFSTMDGRPKSHKQIMRDHIRPACDRLGLPRVSWMTFRRTFSTWADEEGVSAKQRGVLMGNSAEVNHRVYTQARDEGLRQGVERVSARIVQYCSVSKALAN